MTEMALMKWLLLLGVIARTEGLQSSDTSVSEEILKTILESCYKNNSFPNPVIILADFNKFIDGVSIVRINDFLDGEDYKINGSLKFKASSVVLMEEAPEKLILHLELLSKTKLWDNTIPFFIIGKNATSCENSNSILRSMWRMEILNSIYICAKSINDTSEIYTLNPITNYAPYPWEIIEELDYLTVFRQNFDANISCTHLTYDKTKILDGYYIVVVDWWTKSSGWVPSKSYVKKSARHRALVTIIKALDASGRIQFETGVRSMLNRHYKGTADIMAQAFALHALQKSPYVYPHHDDEMVAVVKLEAEVSTLEKIRQLWSTPVLIAAALALAVLFLILMIKTWSFGSALLDITRLLTYTSIQTDNRYQSFRIYFTTMLIFMVISNGVFQGKIAAFLTTREKSSPPESIRESIKLGYQMYTLSQTAWYAKIVCPSCELKEVSSSDECIEVVLNSTENLCLMSKLVYESKYILLPLDHIREPLSIGLASFKCRKNWPLRDRFNGMMMSLVESGLIDFWENILRSIPKTKRQAMEAEWSSPEYRPVVLIKLTFAFQLLAAGLSFAIIVFFLELCWARYVNP